MRRQWQWRRWWWWWWGHFGFGRCDANVETSPEYEQIGSWRPRSSFRCFLLAALTVALVRRTYTEEKKKKYNR